MDKDRMTWLLHFAMKCTKSHMNQAARDKYELLAYSSRLFEQLLDTGDLVCDFEDKGVLTVYLSPKEFDGFQGANAFHEKFGLGYKRLSRDETLNMEPALSSAVVGSWLSKNDWHVRPDRLVSAWKHNLMRRGLKIKEMCRATGFSYENGTIRAVKTNQGTCPADAFVLAAGAWTPQIAAFLNLRLPIQPGKGYSITMNRPEICPDLPCMFHERNVVVTPWKSGYRLGGTMEFSGFSNTLNRTRLNKLVQGAAEYLRTPVGHPIIEEWGRTSPHVLG